MSYLCEQIHYFLRWSLQTFVICCSLLTYYAQICSICASQWPWSSGWAIKQQHRSQIWLISCWYFSISIVFMSSSSSYLFYFILSWGYFSIPKLELTILKITYAEVPTHMMLSIRDMCRNGIHHAPCDDTYIYPVKFVFYCMFFILPISTCFSNY